MVAKNVHERSPEKEKITPTNTNHSTVLICAYSQVQIDTTHFKGNFPDVCKVEGKPIQCFTF